LNVTNAKQLYQIYLNKDYYFHVKNDPPKLIQNINDVQRSTSILLSFMTLLKETFLILVIVTLLLFSDPGIFITIFTVLSFPILFYNYFFRKRLKDRGTLARNVRIKSLKEITQGFAGIKFTKLLNLENFLTKSFRKNLNSSSSHDMFVRFLSSTPRVFLELLSILTILVIILMFINQGRNFNELLPILTFTVVATVKLIPSFGNIISSLNNFKFNSVSLDNVYLTLLENDQHKEKFIDDEKKEQKDYTKQFLKVDQIHFGYPDKNQKIINNLTFYIDKKDVVGITGGSGSGKTTLVDIILGLLYPSKGSIKNFGVDIRTFLKSWRKKIGYVPQNLSLIDGSIKDNICLGHLESEIDSKLLEKCINISELNYFVDALPDGLETNVGHLGKKISGGQLQRIGIARALYQNPDILIFDEATNALDINVEDKLIKNLKKFSKDLTIILISHRLSVLKNCNKILLIENGKIKFEGPFESLPDLRKE
jgi:ABC-type bacteriocin/lantibiotic exporter with double-glycine peptidase domain